MPPPFSQQLMHVLSLAVLAISSKNQELREGTHLEVKHVRK